MKDNKLVIGIVGYGYWGPNLLRNFMECRDVVVKYVCDKSEKQLNRVNGKYPSVGLIKDFEQLIHDAEIDAVVIATPISTHYDLAKQALLAGKHVFVEKPLTSSAIEAQELISLAKSKGLTLMVGHTFEYSSPVMKIKELIEAGELGNIYYISSSRINLGLHQSDASVIWDLAPHDFSMIFYWLNEEPTEITSFGRSCIQSGIPDVAFINLGFGSGIVAQIQLSWLAPVKLRRTLIVGDKKMLVYDDTESVEKIKLYDHGVDQMEPNSFGEYQLSYRTGDIVSPRLESSEPLLVEAKHFIDCIHTGVAPRTDGYSGLRVVKALEMADASLYSNGNLRNNGNGKTSDNGNGYTLDGEDVPQTMLDLARAKAK